MANSGSRGKLQRPKFLVRGTERWRASVFSIFKSLVGRAMAVLAVVILAGGGLFAGIEGQPAAAENILEYQVKAAMLYKFLSYIDWPPDSFAGSEDPFRIAVVGASSVGRQLRELTENRTVGDRPIEVQSASTTRQIGDPHIVFVGRHAQKNLQRIVHLAEQRSFLVVTEKDEGLPQGSTINLRAVDGRMGFDVSLVNAQRAGVKLSARLLSVASTVDQEDI